MTLFRYRAARPDGELLSGTVRATTASAALQLVESRGLLPVEIAEARAEVGARRLAGDAELAAVLAGLAALLETGLPVDRALGAAQEGASPRLAAAVEAARERVREGAALSAALEAAGALPPLVIGYLKAGERSGHLAPAISRAAADLERAAELRSHLTAALTYPAFLLGAGTISVVTIVAYVVPRFARLLGEQGRTLPASTRFLIAASHLVGAGLLPLVVGAALLLFTGQHWLRTADGSLALHRQLLELPVIGTLRLRLATARACGTLASLLEAGVPVLLALRLAGEATSDAAVETRIAAARVEVERGERLAAALRRHHGLSPAALRLVAFGEQSGRLAPFLAHAARLEETAAHRALQRLVTLLEPVLILTFGALVAFVAAALLQAVYSVRPARF